MTSILIGLLSLIFLVFMVGSVSALFLVLMTRAAEFFLEHPSTVWALPLLGLITGWVYWHRGRHWPNTPQILNSVHEQNPSIPATSGFSIFAFTILSQVFGASTGRESTAVQFGAGLAEFLRKKSAALTKKAPFFSREVFIRCGLAAGFGAVFGVPWAGALFALESTSRKWGWKSMPAALFASLGAHVIASALGASHRKYPLLPVLPWDLKLIAQWLAFAIVIGFSAKFFLLLLRFVERLFSKCHPLWLRPGLGGLIIALLTAFVFHNTRYNGLGLPLLEEAFSAKSTSGFYFLDALWKSIFTVVSTGSGLKGGEVTPLMSIGAVLGLAVSPLLMLPASYAASLGLVCLFATSAHLPWTGAVMAWEFFGFEAFLPVFVVCWVACRLVGRQSLFLKT